jgi:subtilisin family serine protease
MAAPIVSGAAAIVLGKYPSLSPAQLANHLQLTADTITTDQPIGKRLNLYRAVTTVPVPVPYDTDQDGDVDWLDLYHYLRYGDFTSIFDFNQMAKIY